MPLTRLDNLLSSKTGKYLYVSPDDFNASDSLDNRGTSPTRPFLTIQRAFLEVARFSYVPGPDNDRFDQFTILLAPGTHYIDNRPGDATATSVPVFNYSAGEWNDTTSFDLSDPNNVLRRFNSVEGGCIIPRGTSLVGTDLRRTQVRPLYVPDPADKDIGRTSIFQVTGGCYFWQFTILDGDLSVNSPLWNSVQNIGKVYSQPDSSVLSIPEYSHHKITNFVFARKEDLGALYAKVAKAFSAYQPTIDDPGEFDYRIQENRIVGPLSDSVTIESIKVDNITTGPAAGTADITVNTKINHGYFVGQYVAVTGMNAGQGKLNGVWKVKSINSTNLKQFVFNVPYNAAGLGLVPSGTTWTESTTPKLSSVGTTASVQAEVDSVESASPYVFNVSIRSTWGICGIWADGSRATGFKSMVIAQYTGVSLQKDDRAFIKYDEFTNTWNQANLQDAFSSTPYHIDGTAYWKDDWRNFHVRASEDAFIQNVSIFAVGFADHFLMESGGDMSITNSNSNFGNTSLHAIGYKNYAFNQDKGGYISHIIPPKKLLDTDVDIKNYYTLNVTLSNDVSNTNRLYYGIDEASDPTNRPSSSIDGFKLGAKSGEKLYVKLDAVAGESGKQVKSSIVSPNGVKKWRASLAALSPTGQVVGDLDGDGDSDDAQDVVQYNLRLDAANLIDSNKAFIQSEAFGYILEKYPVLQTTPYVNPGVTGDTNRYRDASNLIRSNRQAIIDSAFDQIAIDHPTFVHPDPARCRRDIGYIVDALISDLYNGANSASIDAARAYFNATTTSTTTPSTENATASVTSTQLSGTLPSTLFPTAGTSGQNPDVSWSFSLPTALTNAGVSISSYDLLLEDLHAVDVNGFPQIHWKIDSIPNTITSIPTNAAQLNIPGATFRPSYLGSPNTTGVSPVGYSGLAPGAENHTYRLTVRANLSNSSSTVVTSLQFNYDDAFSAPTVDGSFSLPRTTVRSNNLVVNYNIVTVINAGTPITNGLVGEETESITAFNKVAVEAKKAMRNQLAVTDLTIIADPVTGSNTSNSSCANVATTIDNLISIVTTAVGNGNLNSLPPRNGGSWLSDSKCKRDIGYIVEAVTSDLRLGGNENIINAAEAYYVGTNLDYINNELNETLDAYNYVRDLSIAAMRNWSFDIQNASTTNGSAIVTVASTVGVVMGMRVVGTGIPTNTYVKRIINGTTFELGNSDSRLTTGVAVNATSTSTTTTLTLTLDAGIWAEVDNLDPITDSSVIPDTNYPECAGVATAITTYFTAISTILSSGLGTVSRTPSTVSGASISTRATLFTLTEVGTVSSTNPHNLETGTPVKLVPRAINETVDKRVVRLPKGFDSNTKYYVIAPGRSTEPFDFSNYTSPSGNVPFDGSAGSQQAIMLATSIENANAGIYIYSPETETVDSGVVIEVHQYVQDVNYDLIQYRCSIVPGSNSVFATEGPHSFDKQQTNTTPQTVFFRGGSQAPDISGSILPIRTTGGTIPDDAEYFVRYVPPAAGQSRNTRFTIHTSHTDAINGTNEVTFSNNGTSFYVFSNKRRAPVRFAPEANLIDVEGNKGSWYINTSAINNGIIERLQLPVYDDSRGKTRTTDTWFERIRDEREISDTIYRLRYVIPKDGNYREPINGFVFKLRTDETRRLLPQKILLRPVGAASSFANVTKNGERLGLTTTEQINGSAYNTANPNFIGTYDPYVDPFAIETDSDINFSVQSAKKVRISNNDYLQLTVFDVSVVDAALKTSIFTTVKVDTPQGGTGNFVVGSSITWAGNSSGSGVVHAWFPTHNYLIIKNAIGELNYSSSSAITFTQGSITARMIEEKDGGRSDRSKYLYAVEGANVYTLTPGDTVTLPVTTGGTAQYRIDSVEDVSDLENTYYVFKSETIRRRIKGQQDGVYYITAIRGDIRPFPTGSGVGINFRNFKFSQPVSRIYPLPSKNDPLWFQVNDSVVNQENPNRDITIVDPPETVSSADNYTHGYVSVNDAKRSVTKEAILDLTQDPGIGIRTYTNDNRIQAKEGGASAGSEARKIPIAGDSDFSTEQRVYVELRRPSIARSGNHTFEYLGFGPGNYSTGFPARQQVILTDVQDFYAQAKRQDAGLVLYTGLNSSGDLYIGNRKINAITGEETLLDAPIIEEEDEEVGISGALVTTFDDPVTFNNTVTFNYNQVIPATLSVVNIGVPVLINSEAVNTSGAVIRPPLSIQNYTAEATQEEYDPLRNGLTETMSFGNNIATFGVWRISPRGSQTYSIRTHKNNITPNTQPTSGAPYNNFYNTTQLLNTSNGNWGNVTAKPGTILYKGSQVNYSGSLGWIYANDYTSLTTTGVSPQVTTIQTFVGYTVVKVSFSATLGALGIKPDTQFRTTNSSNAVLNSGVDGIPFSIPVSVLIDSATAGGIQISESGYPGSSSNYVWLNIAPNAAVASSTQLADNLGPINVSISNSFWKEVGVIGAEAIRTETESLGNYKVGVNTLARATDTAYQNAFVETQVYPAANLDVEGNAFISGKATASSISSGGTNTKTITNVDHALLVGGEYTTPANTATLRVARTDNSSPTATYQTGGRVGINVPFADLDRNLTVRGNGRITGDFKFENNIEVNGTTTATSATLSTTNNTFNLINQNATTLNFGGAVTTGNIFNTATASQTLNIGTAVTGTTTLNIHTATSGATINIASNNTSTSANIQLGNIGNSNLNTSLITIGGAFDAPQNSIFTVRNAQTILAGSLEVNGGVLQTDANGTADFPLQLWTRAGASTYVDAFTRAVQLRLGAVAGTTTIRNQLEVKSDVNFFGDVIMNGGNNSGQLTVARAQLNTTATSHNIGSVNSLNVDYYRRIEEIASITGIETLVDTGGVAPLPSTATIIAVQTNQNGAGIQPGTIQNASTGTNPLTNINIGDYLLIDEEIVRVIAPGPGTNPITGAREIPVERGADCTTPAIHLDNSIIYKLDKTIDASYITANIDAVSTSVNLGEFGGIFEVNDYLRLSSTDTCPSGEFVRITAVNDSDAEDFIINDGAGNDRFVVDSVCGGLTSTITSDCDFTIQLTTNDNQFIIASDTVAGGTPELTISRDGSILQIGDGTLAAPAAKYDGSGSASLSGNLLITNTNALDTSLDNGRFKVTQSSGDVDIAGGIDMDGDIKVYNGSTGINFTGVPNFQVLSASGNVSTVGSITITNGGNEVFQANNDGSIDIAGIEDYFTSTGGRRSIYLTSGATLQSNITYLVNLGSDTQFLLPTAPQTGDIIRFIDIGGTLTYSRSMIIRAQSNHNIQGDNTGSKAGGLVAAYTGGGELIVQTRNAAFGLVYAGATDTAGTLIPAGAQGWWIMEI